MRRGIFLLLALAFPASALAGPGRVTSTLTIGLGPGRETSAVLSLPASRKPGERLPAMLIFGGFESAGQVLGLLNPATPVALASFDYPYSAPRKLTFPESLKELPQARLLYPSMIRGILSLIAELKKRPEIDPTRIVLIGASFGAPFVLGAASASEDVSGVVVVHGFGQLPETAENVIMRSWGRRYGAWMRPLAWALSRFLWAYLRVPAPEDLARALKPAQRVFMITAEKDSFVPREAADALWDAVRSSPARSAREVMPGDHLMPGSDQLIATMIGKVESWMRLEGLVAR